MAFFVRFSKNSVTAPSTKAGYAAQLIFTRRQSRISSTISFKALAYQLNIFYVVTVKSVFSLLIRFKLVSPVTPPVLRIRSLFTGSEFTDLVLKNRIRIQILLRYAFFHFVQTNFWAIFLPDLNNLVTLNLKIKIYFAKAVFQTVLCVYNEKTRFTQGQIEYRSRIEN